MKKHEFLAMANKGFIPYRGTTIAVTTRHNEDGDSIMEYTISRMNPYSTNARFGGGMLELTPDEAYTSIGQTIEQAIEKMHMMEQRASLDPLVLVTEKWNSVRSDSGTLYGLDRYKDEHFSIYALSGNEMSYPLCRPVMLDGVTYAPVYSFWLGQTVFLLNSPDGYQK